MSTSDFLKAAAKKKVRKAIEAIEAETGAEVVVSVRKQSGFYRHADYLFGALFALLGLSLFLYHPEPFDWTFLPAELCGFFGVGALLSALVPPLRRALVLRPLLDGNVVGAARAAFVELGIGRTRERVGVLVYASLFERRVSVVPDVGIDEVALGAEWSDAKKKLDRALRLDADVDRFVEALAALGPILSTAHPRREDDQNELSDAVDGDGGDDGDDGDDESPSEEGDEGDDARRGEEEARS